MVEMIQGYGPVPGQGESEAGLSDVHWSPRKDGGFMVGSGFRRVFIKEQSSKDTLTRDFNRSFQTCQEFEISILKKYE